MIARNDDARLANLIGALSLTAMDRMSEATQIAVGYAGSAPAGLLTIVARPGISIESLRRILNLSQPATVRLVDRLAAAGLVTRGPGADGRTVALTATPAGCRRAGAAVSARHDSLVNLLGPLDDAGRDILTELLERLLAVLPRSREHARHLCRLCDHTSCEQPFCPIDQAVPT